MKRILSVILIFICVCFNAQNPSFFIESNSSINMGEVKVKQLLIEDSLLNLSNKRTPPRFAVSSEINLSSNTFGEWSQEGIYKVWQTEIQAENALSLSASIYINNMPETAYVLLENEQGKIFGPYYTSAFFENKFQTFPLKGNRLNIYYYVPKNTQSELTISHVAQGYKDIYAKTDEFIKKGFGDSGDCNINTACKEGIPWRKQIQSVAINILDNGTRWCSGCMVGNTRKDSVPYFLSAYHCIDKNDNGVISTTELADIATWTFHFNYNSPQCDPNEDGELDQMISGAELVAANYETDMLLLKLSTSPPEEYNVYYAGWDRNPLPANNAFAIHHPNGDVKKISIENDLVIDSPLEPTYRWRVPGWDIGVTEPGSSGSPLFNEFGCVIGQLYGGAATCSNLSNTNPNDDFDEYGKFNVSWDTDSEDTAKLAPWLDPDNLDSTKIQGYYLFGNPFLNSEFTLKDNTFDIYPNPVNSNTFKINLKLNALEKEGKLVIYNVLGELIHEQNIPNNVAYYSIHSNNLQAGTYYVKVTMGEKYDLKKILIFAD